mgnify:CR=1 FL=1
MKKIILIYFLISLFALDLYSNAITGIAINVYIPENISLQSESRSYLTDKVSQLLSENHILGKNYSDRFYLTAKIHIVEKNIVGGMPQRVSQKIEVTYKIGDAVDNIVYSTLSQTYVGIGTNETKSQINAFAQIKSNLSYRNFFNEAKERISAYYSQRCESIIQEAELSSQNKEYSKAIYKLSLIPYGVACYNNVLNLMKIYYQEKIEYENLELLNKAQQIWSSSPNKEGAQKAIVYLEQMKADQKNQKEIQELLASMNTKLREDEVREWDFMLRQYEQEQILKQQEQVLQQQAEQNETDIFNTCLQLGFEFLSNSFQPINIIETLLLW